MSDRITFSDLMQLDTPDITGTQAAQAMGMSPTRLLEYAREDLTRLPGEKRIPFPCILSGNSLKVPRVPFLEFWGCIKKNSNEDILKELITIREQIAALIDRQKGGAA